MIRRIIFPTKARLGHKNGQVRQWAKRGFTSSHASASSSEDDRAKAGADESPAAHE